MIFNESFNLFIIVIELKMRYVSKQQTEPFKRLPTFEINTCVNVKNF